MKKLFTITAFFAFIASTAIAAPSWKCTQTEGWGVDQSGVKAPIKVDQGFSIRQFSAPDKMVVLHAENKMDKDVFEAMRYGQIGSSYFGRAVMKDGFFKFTVSEVLQETESTMTAIFEKGDQAAIVKKYRCERVM